MLLSDSPLSKQETKKKQKQELVQKQKKAENKNVQKLAERLDELRKKEKYVDVAICPRCKSVNLRRVKSTMGDTTGHLGWLPVIYECLDCGWRGRLEIFATNKKQNWKEVAVMAEARDSEEED
jgi:predicted RNA-binding Zn-ribbon protein involved in translation (DUF1610 family)